MNTAAAFNPVLLFISILGVTVGLLLLLLAWHGRRMDNHPICRKCGFDLYGCVDGADRCSECGADISNLRNVRHGRRKKRPGVLAVSLIVLLGSTAMFVVAASPVARSIQWIRMMPTAWLIDDLDSTNAADETTAVRELARRLRQGTLEDETFESLIDIALQKQADRTRPWLAPYGDILEIALLTDRLTDDEEESFLRNAIQPTLFVAAAGDDDDDTSSTISLGYRSGTLHVGSNGMLALGATLERWRVDDGAWNDAADNRATISIFGGSSSQVLAVNVETSVEPGTHAIETEWQFDFVTTLDGYRSQKPLASNSQTLSGEFTLE